MVVKPYRVVILADCSFESSVISFGSKTSMTAGSQVDPFESSVISFGSKTVYKNILDDFSFESSVISFGSKTRICSVDKYP